MIWTFPLAFAAHEVEEVLFASRLRELLEDVEGFERVPAWTRSLARLSRGRFAAGVWFNVGHVASHLLSPILTRRYVPGMLTAPAIALPHGVWTLRRLAGDGRLDTGSLARSLAWSIPLGAATVIGARVAARALVPA